MNVISRGVRNACRNVTRSVSIVVILGLSIGLALTMLIARQAVGQKIDSVKSSVGNTITIAPAGIRGFSGGGTPLTTSQLAAVQTLPHVASISESLNDRLTSSDTNLQSSIELGNFGRRQAQIDNQGSGGGNSGFGGGDNFNPARFTAPVIVLGTTNLTQLDQTAGGGTAKITSGKSFDPTVDANVALVGTTLASKNSLGAGATFTAYGSTITVAGIFDAGNTFANSELIMPLPTVQRLSSQPGDVTSAVVQVDSISNLSDVTSAIKTKLGSAADVTSSQDNAQTTINSLSGIRNVSLFSLIGAVIAGSVIILLTMIMIVRERRREIGVLKAIGSSNLRIIFQFLVEAITLTLLGAVIGLGLGVVGGNPVTNILVTNSSNSSASQMTVNSAGGTRRFYGGAAFRSLGNNLAINNLRNIHAVVGWSILLYGLSAALAIAIIGSAIAASLIAKVRPAEVMRAE